LALRISKRIRGLYWGYIGEKNLQGIGLGDYRMDEVQKKVKDLNISALYLHVLENNLKAI
jgi:hypothetical protein